MTSDRRTAPLLDPALQGADFRLAELSPGIRRRHPHGFIGRTHANEQLAAFRIAGNDCDGPTVRRGHRRFAQVQPKSGLARLFVLAVTTKTVSRQNRSNIPAVVQFLRGQRTEAPGAAATNSSRDNSPMITCRIEEPRRVSCLRETRGGCTACLLYHNFFGKPRLSAVSCRTPDAPREAIRGCTLRPITSTRSVMRTGRTPSVA